MLRLTFMLAVLSSPTAYGDASLSPPISDAATGRLQCYQPDTARKTCQSLASYRIDKAGKIVNSTTVLLSPSAPVAMTTATEIKIRSGQVCGYVTPEGLAAATFAVGDEPATAKQTAILRERTSAAQRGVFGREVCTAYIADGNSIIAKTTLGGVAQPAWDQKVIWVSPGEGYKVAP